MSEQAEFWKAMQAAKQQEKAEKRAEGLTAIRASGLEFQSFNCGAHLRIKVHGATFDFWPGTGKWRERGKGTRSGLEELLKRLSKVAL